MPESEAELRELDELRQKVTEYEAALRSAAPRLAAFKRLEQLARAQGSTPEAVAAQAAIEVLTREKDALVTLLAGLANERDQLKGEMAMLLINKTEASKAVESLTGRHQELNIEVADLLERLTEIRRDAVRLMSHRSELAVEVTSLRGEAQALQDAIDHANRAIAYNDAIQRERNAADAAAQQAAVEDPARRAEDRPRVAESTVGEEVVLDEVGSHHTVIKEIAVEQDAALDDRDEASVMAERSFDEVSPEAEALAAELAQNKKDKLRRQGLTPRRTVAASIEADDETEQLESQAFDAFFHAEIDHDKSRDWILG